MTWQNMHDVEFAMLYRARGNSNRIEALFQRTHYSVYMYRYMEKVWFHDGDLLFCVKMHFHKFHGSKYLNKYGESCISFLHNDLTLSFMKQYKSIASYQTFLKWDILPSLACRISHNISKMLLLISPTMGLYVSGLMLLHHCTGVYMSVALCCYIIVQTVKKFHFAIFHAHFTVWY